MASTFRTYRLHLATWWKIRCGILPYPLEESSFTVSALWCKMLLLSSIFFTVLVFSGILLSLYYEPSARPLFIDKKPITLGKALQNIVINTDTLCLQNEIVLLPIVGKTAEFPTDELQNIQIPMNSSGEPLVVSAANASVERTIMQEIPFGAVIRGIHRWSVHCFIASLICAAGAAFWNRKYRAPLELLWWITIALILCSCFSAFSGHILVWNIKSYLSAQIAMSVLENLPGGETLASILRGGRTIHPEILPRMYALHSIIFPMVILVLLRFSLNVSRKFGTVFYIQKTYWLTCFSIILFLGIIATILPHFGSYYERIPADSTVINIASFTLYPEWYFIALYQLLKIVPLDFAAVLIVIFVLFWFSLPLTGSLRKNRIIMWLTGIGLLVSLIILTIAGLCG